MFKQLRPLLKIGAELRRIADALEFFAIREAQRTNSMYVPRSHGRVNTRDESELLHTDDHKIRLAQEEEMLLLLQRGYPAIEAQDETEQE